MFNSQISEYHPPSPPPGPSTHPHPHPHQATRSSTSLAAGRGRRGWRWAWSCQRSSHPTSTMITTHQARARVRPCVLGLRGAGPHPGPTPPTHPPPTHKHTPPPHTSSGLLADCAAARGPGQPEHARVLGEPAVRAPILASFFHCARSPSAHDSRACCSSQAARVFGAPPVHACPTSLALAPHPPHATHTHARTQTRMQRHHLPAPLRAARRPPPPPTPTPRPMHPPPMQRHHLPAPL